MLIYANLCKLKIYGILKSFKTKSMEWNFINKHKYAFLRKCVEASKAVTKWLIF